MSPIHGLIRSFLHVLPAEFAVWRRSLVDYREMDTCKLAFVDRVCYAAALVVAVFVASVIFTAISGLCELSTDDVVSQASLIKGDLRGVFLTQFLWDRYPQLPRLSVIMSLKACVWTGPALALAVYLFQFRARRPILLMISLAAAAAVPYSAGILVLRSHAGTHGDLTYAGPAIHMMLAGPLYVCFACIALCGLNLLRTASQPTSHSVAVEPA